MAYCDGSSPTYYAVLFTNPSEGPAHPEWARTLRLMAALAEEQPGYEGYAVEQAEGGREYAVTYWSTPKAIAGWKGNVGKLIGDKALLDALYGKEGCVWPWMRTAQAA